MIAQALVWQARSVILLYPFHAAGGQIGSGAQAGAVRQDFVSEVCDFERHSIGGASHAENSEEFSADFIHIRIAPLDYMGDLGQSSAEGFEFIACHRVQLRGSRGVWEW